MPLVCSGTLPSRLPLVNHSGYPSPVAIFELTDSDLGIGHFPISQPEANIRSSPRYNSPQGPEEDVDRVPGVAYAPKHPSYAEGNVAYARRQAEILHTRAAQFEEMWVDAADFIDMGRTAVGQDDNVAVGADADADGMDKDDMVLDGEASDEQLIPPRPVPQPLSFVEGVADQG
ncbi:hypothetical protein C8F04DRAFT_1257406 [Mycena alexandri]|uniref:Uncharacterized protein n=1 Tax=Mycena alexandri TaxID=1745969 RepID=A0AAD6X338_9AGAR|nr:hypothetical protein C8F04DRAFT_1257406 [Mycena alexandri]